MNQEPSRPQNFVPNFETWDLRRGERTSCSATISREDAARIAEADGLFTLADEIRK